MSEGQNEKISRIAKEAAQAVAKGNCHHTNIRDMQTLEAIVNKAIHDGAGHWMNGFADAHARINNAIDVCSGCGVGGDHCECDHCQMAAKILSALKGGDDACL